MGDVIRSLEDYWILVFAHRRRGSKRAFEALRLMSTKPTRAGLQARDYVRQITEDKDTRDVSG